ncbi:uncharacterized protein LOC118185562 [Stegodyphus dumicola]|uniref:uncharacterized protein LOC118185562 n=1 Tax=Stegodyphus dumicola TaxID=202533 RepID=UPI0015AE1506|nr:uncharacterized protein LOC118185562 [Stegodyphus dumicola]
MGTVWRMSKKFVPVLGLLWDKTKDVLFCDLEKIYFKQKPITRRYILWTVHSIFDPIGILCPVTIRLKRSIQNSWNLKIGWDETCLEDNRLEFNKWLEDLYLLTEIKIPRYVQSNVPEEKLSFHTFCDANKSAYSAIVFLRSECEKG